MAELEMRGAFAREMYEKSAKARENIYLMERNFFEKYEMFLENN